MLRGFSSKSKSPSILNSSPSEVDVAHELYPFRDAALALYSNSSMAASGSFKEAYSRKDKKQATEYDAALQLIPKDIKLTSVIGNNNVNFIFSKKDTTVVLQCGDQPVGYEKFKNSSEYFVKSFGDPKIGDGALGVFVEKLTSLDHAYMKLDDNARLKFAAQVGKDLSIMLNELQTKNILWTDLKPGNILIREGKIPEMVIVDLKGFTHLQDITIKEDTIYTRLKKNEASEGYRKLNATLSTSPPYLSQDNETMISYITKISEGTKPLDHANEARNAIFEKWEKEYSYQLATVLYVIAANVNEKSEDFLKDGKINFDFNKDVFKTIEGRKLRDLIRWLADPDPNKRLSILIAAGYLKNLSAPHNSTADIYQSFVNLPITPNEKPFAVQSTNPRLPVLKEPKDPNQIRPEKKAKKSIAPPSESSEDSDTRRPGSRK